MRSDMHKVICEEPRHGGGRSKQNRRANLPDELLPKSEGMRRPYANRKWFGEHLGPLRRWLRSQVGRVWNEVYSEACQVITADSVVRAHIKTHMMEMVERNTFMKNGKVWCFTSRRWFRTNEIPVEEIQSRWHPFYVYPKTGVLCEIPQRKRKGQFFSYERRDLILQSVRRWQSENRLLIQWRGCWFECEMASVCHAHFFPPFDAVWKMRIGQSHAGEAYGRESYCVGKRQLSAKELKRFGLKNSPENKNASLDIVLGEDLLRRMRGANGNPVRRCVRIASGRFDHVELIFDGP